jgi:hypothetical protein
MTQAISAANEPTHPQQDWQTADKKHLLEKLLTTLKENVRLKATVTRLMRQTGKPPVVRHAGRVDDFVPMGWVDQHGIRIPRADGLFESPRAWVRITHGVITNAGLKNQSILAVMIAAEEAVAMQI